MAYPRPCLAGRGKTASRGARLAATFLYAVNVLSIHGEKRMSVCW